ncbi:MAG TPA: DUF190 domain-containing protein [Balneolales bacterium]|nr:DUF190 domain-containing protein [Balneolales bacterium]
MDTNSKLLRIFVGEQDKVGHEPLYEEIVFEAKRQKLAGATVTKGVMSYGANSLIHRAKLVDISEDLPIVIEIVDTEDKIDKFLDSVNELLEKSGSGGIITIEKATVIHYKPHKKD